MSRQRVTNNEINFSPHEILENFQPARAGTSAPFAAMEISAKALDNLLSENRIKE
jgi:hypothetical protein